MATIEEIVRQINRELSPQFEERLRALLADKDREWLVDQLVRLTLDSHSLEDLDVAAAVAAKARRRDERLDRVRAMAIDATAVIEFTSRFDGMTRERAIADCYLRESAPIKGTQAIEPDDRTPDGERVVSEAKDMLYALLFGDERTATRLKRVQQEVLTMVLPRFKADALDFMRASTELTAAGTWQDPQSVSNDERAENVLLEVQFGETADEIVGHAVVAALSVINNLEINEQVLYARMINVEESTLIS
ncbi:MAG: hypothetical protein ABIP53_10170 [Candidatus Limnocylindrales bacterium]